MKKAKIRPLATPKPVNRSSQKLAGVITSWTAPGMQNFVSIGPGVSVTQIRDFAMLLGWLVCSFLGFFNKATAYTLEWIFTPNTSKRRHSGQGSVFRGHDEWLYVIFDPHISEKPPFWGPILTGLSFFSTENRFNMGMLQYKTTLNRHRSPIKVV